MNNQMNTQETYRFYVCTADGTETEWCNLTRKQARDMYAYTDAHQPSNITDYGWELVQHITMPFTPESLPQNS